jgi:hypothetical protein
MRSVAETKGKSIRTAIVKDVGKGFRLGLEAAALVVRHPRCQSLPFVTIAHHLAVVICNAIHRLTCQPITRERERERGEERSGGQTSITEMASVDADPLVHPMTLGQWVIRRAHPHRRASTVFLGAAEEVDDSATHTGAPAISDGSWK